VQEVFRITEQVRRGVRAVVRLLPAIWRPGFLVFQREPPAEIQAAFPGNSRWTF